MTKHRQHQNQKLAKQLANMLPCPVGGWYTTKMSRESFIKICAKKRAERTEDGIRHPQCRNCQVREAIRLGIEFTPPPKIVFWNKDSFAVECEKYYKSQEPICQSPDPETTPA